MLSFFYALSLIIYSPIIARPKFKADFVGFYASPRDDVSRHSNPVTTLSPLRGVLGHCRDVVVTLN